MYIYIYPRVWRRGGGGADEKRSNQEITETLALREGENVIGGEKQITGRIRISYVLN